MYTFCDKMSFQFTWNYGTVQITFNRNQQNGWGKSWSTDHNNPPNLHNFIHSKIREVGHTCKSVTCHSWLHFYIIGEFLCYTRSLLITWTPVYLESWSQVHILYYVLCISHIVIQVLCQLYNDRNSRSSEELPQSSFFLHKCGQQIRIPWWQLTHYCTWSF